MKRCRHCGILFLTDARNRCRNDLRCPFGCREEHRKRSSAERSKEYYRSDVGKFKKKMHNARRKNKSEVKTTKKVSAEFLVKDRIINYIRLTTSLIEDRFVSRDEVTEMIRELMRQHSIDLSEKTNYRNKRMKKRPP